MHAIFGEASRDVGSRSGGDGDGPCFERICFPSTGGVCLGWVRIGIVFIFIKKRFWRSVSGVGLVGDIFVGEAEAGGTSLLGLGAAEADGALGATTTVSTGGESVGICPRVAQVVREGGREEGSMNRIRILLYGILLLLNHLPPPPFLYPSLSSSDIEFSMTKTLVAVVFVGALYGYLLASAISLFFLPAWLLALTGGGIGGYTATLRDGRGDMVRCLGMKLVAFFGLIKAVEEELSVWRKLGKVCHISYGHAAKFDERWKVREKLWRVGGWVSGKLTKEAERVRGDRMEGEGGREGGGGFGGYPGGGFEQPTYRGEERWQGGGGGEGGGGRAGGKPPVNPSWGQR